MNIIKEKIIKMSKKEYSDLIKDLAHKQLFNINEEEQKIFEDSFKQTVYSFDSFEKINTDNIEPLNYPIENPYFYLRSDSEIIELNGKEWVDTQNHNNEGYVEVKYEK